MPETLRTFIAIEIPPETKEALSQVQAHWRKVAPLTIRWVDTQGLHLTLKFLGDIDRDQVATIPAAMERAANGVAAFTLGLGEAGAFPSPQRPRVVWVGVTGQIEPLRVLVQRLEAELLTLRFPKEERALSPHLTLGRIRNPQGALPMVREPIPPVNWQVDHIDLMQTTLSSSGATYTRLSKVALQGEPF